MRALHERPPIGTPYQIHEFMQLKAELGRYHFRRDSTEAHPYSPTLERFVF